MRRSRIVATLACACVLGCNLGQAGGAQENGGDSGSSPQLRVYRSRVLSSPEDPQNFLPEIRRRGQQRDSLFPVSPLRGLHDATDRGKDSLYNATHLKLGLNLNHLFQWMSDARPDKDKWGTTTDLDFMGTWELLKIGKPNQGQIYFHVEGRWDYGTTGPQTLGFDSLGSAIGTGNAFSKYTPAFLPFRNLYWQQGSHQAGWVYRMGKITTDATLATSKHISPVTTFLPNGGTGLFASGYPDSGIGALGTWYFSDRFAILGLVSDVYGDRQTFGSPGKGDYYKALEFSAKIAPRTKDAGYSKFTFWQTPGGKAINAATGLEGWGMTVKLEQELTEDGKAIGVFRWGRSWKDAAFYKQQAGVHFLYYEPQLVGTIKHDLIGTAFNWVKPSDDARDEYNVELFYRFPIFPLVDTTLSYQSAIKPAGAPDIDHASVFSLRLRTVF